MQASTQAQTAVHQIIPIALLDPSPTNPRKTFDKVTLAELGESVKDKGILQPIIARPKPVGRFEIVAGERRWRAAGIAKLADIPAMVRDYTDKEVAEIQTIENVQREDLHPLEEAEGYDQLVKHHGYDAQGIADKVGKSKSYVEKRMKLCALCEKAREPFHKGALDLQKAFLIARIPNEDIQLKALAAITKYEMTLKEATEIVRRNFMLRLADAAFDTKDAKLCPAAGACINCPKRTGASPELFPDVKKDDLCTDPKCFDEKLKAHREALLARAQAKGLKVLSGADAQKVKPYEHSSLLNGYVRPSDRCFDDPKHRTYAQLLGKRAPAPTLLDDGTGAMLQIFPKSEVSVILKDIHPKLKQRAESSSMGRNPQQRAQELKQRTERAIRVAVLDAIGPKVGGKLFGRDDFALVATEFYLRHHYDWQKLLCVKWGWEEAWRKDRDAPVKSIAKLDLGQLMVFVLDCALIGETQVLGQGKGQASSLFGAAKRYKVDHEQIRRELTAAAKAKASKSKATAKAKDEK